MSATDRLTDVDVVQYHSEDDGTAENRIPCRTETKEELHALRENLNEGLNDTTFTYDDLLQALFLIMKVNDPGEGLTLDDLPEHERNILNVILEASAFSRHDVPGENEPEDDADAGGE